MILPNLLFDVVVFGLMAVAVLLDALQPVTSGAATLLMLGFLVFLTSEDAAHLARRTGWGQESYASGIAVSIAGFVYFWWRNNSDTAATALHICLMLSALMVLIGIVAAFGAALKEKRARPVMGLVVTSITAVVLGAAGGQAILFWTSTATLPLKLAVLAAGFVVSLAASRVGRKPAAATAAATAATATSTGTAAHDAVAQVAAAHEAVAHDAAAPRVLMPAGGTTLDRALPLILLGALAAFVAR